MQDYRLIMRLCLITVVIIIMFLTKLPFISITSSKDAAAAGRGIAGVAVLTVLRRRTCLQDAKCAANIQREEKSLKF